MPSAVLPHELLAAPRNRWDLAVEGLLAALLVFMPFAFGAVDAWSELITIALAAVLSLTVALRAAIDRTYRLPWTWAYVPLVAFVLLVVLQMTPLSRGLIGVLSPATIATHDEFLGAPSDSGTASSAEISLYPLATAHGLRLVLVGVAVFFAVVSTYRTIPQIYRLLVIVFAIGCVEALVALLQVVTWADHIYWIVDIGRIGQTHTAGSFINYSNYSQFMNLSMGAGLGLLLIRLSEDRRLSRFGGARAFGGVQITDHGTILGGLILCGLAVLASMSRNGAISMILAGIVVGSGLFARGTLSRRGWVLAVLPMGALFILLMFGFDDVYERLATLEENKYFDDRWELTLGVLRAWLDFPIFGAGLGTHEYVFPMYETASLAAVAEHADNDYAQLLEETGALGAACVVAFLSIIGVKLIKLCRRGKSIPSSVAFGLVYGLVAVAIHSASDFGQHLPAVFSLSAIACGLAVALHQIEQTAAVAASPPAKAPAAKSPAIAAPPNVMPRRIAAGVLAAGLALAWAWSLSGAYASQVGEQWWWAANQIDEAIQKDPAEATDGDYSDLLAAAQMALDTVPENVRYGYWLNFYRWQSMARRVDPATGQVLLSTQSLPFVARLADELAAVRAVCPTYGPPYGLEGQLRLNVLKQDAGAELIRHGARLSPYDPPTCLIAGELAAREGRKEEAKTLLRRTVEMAPGFFHEVAVLAFNELDDPEFARDLAGDNYGWLEQLAVIAEASAQHAALAPDLHAASEAALRRRAKTSDVTPYELALLASIDAGRGDHDRAINNYKRALNLEYSQVDWRVALARVLIAVGDDVQAMKEVRIVLRLQPNHAAARALAEELTLRVDEERGLPIQTATSDEQEETPVTED
jgi:O-antigen ligase